MGFSLLGLGFGDGVLYGKQKNSILLLTFMLDEMHQASENKYKSTNKKYKKIKYFKYFYFIFFLKKWGHRVGVKK